MDACAWLYAALVSLAVAALFLLRLAGMRRDRRHEERRRRLLEEYGDREG